MKRVLTAILPVLAVWGVYFFKGRIYFRLYPVIMSLIAFSFFFISLFRTPVCETFARRMRGDLDEKGIRYCRKLTVVWTVFLAFNSMASLVSVFLSPGVWAFYNGFLSYLLMGGLFLGEFIYRRRVLNV